MSDVLDEMVATVDKLRKAIERDQPSEIQRYRKGVEELWSGNARILKLIGRSPKPSTSVDMIRGHSSRGLERALAEGERV